MIVKNKQANGYFFIRLLVSIGKLGTKNSSPFWYHRERLSRDSKQAFWSPFLIRYSCPSGPTSHD